MLDRRLVLRGGLAMVAGGSALGPTGMLASTVFAPAAPLVPIAAWPERIVNLTVCLRPFRAAGPRIELERIGRRNAVHHYGHGAEARDAVAKVAAMFVPRALRPPS
jgi:D-amino-acid oxidase